MRPLTEQIILITGATSGLGHRLTSELAGRGAHVIAHGRDIDRLRLLRDELGVETVRADFAALSQVDRLADELLQRHDRIDVLVNNAGIGSGSDPQARQESTDGIELRFAVNYLAGYHLTHRLLPLLVPPARIVNVASAGQQELDFADPQLLTGYSGMAAYMRSKLAQVMFTIDLAEQLRGTDVTANALHPATFMDTAMVRQAGTTPTSTVREGAHATLRLITDPELDGVTGRYFDGTRRAHPHPQALDPSARERLRVLSDELIAAALERGA